MVDSILSLNAPNLTIIRFSRASIVMSTAKFINAISQFGSSFWIISLVVAVTGVIYGTISASLCYEVPYDSGMDTIYVCQPPIDVFVSSFMSAYLFQSFVFYFPSSDLYGCI